MPYPPRTRGQIAYVSVLLAFGALLVVRELLDHHRNSARLVAFRADSACVAPFVASHQAESALCHDVSAVVTARWPRRRVGSPSSDYYLALRVPDGFVDTLMLVSRPSPWEEAVPGTTLVVRQFAASDWPHARVIALVGNGTAVQTAWTSKHPVWRDKPSRHLIRGVAIVVLGGILLILLGVFGREEMREAPQAQIHAT